MICQEVIELMQRYLDQDLDEAEYHTMLQHIQQCDDCAELYQRLVSLSQELEQLPKVTPPYSLVDAIMPQLENIDAGHPRAAADNKPWSSQGSEAPERSSAPVSKKSWRHKARGLVSARWLGGVVAAGLVLGFFVFEQQQKYSDKMNADGLLQSTQSAQTERSTRSDSKAAAAGSSAPASGPGELKKEVTDSAQIPADANGTDALQAPAMAGAANPAQTNTAPAAKRITAAAETPAAPAAKEAPKAKAQPSDAGSQPKASEQAQGQAEPVEKPAPADVQGPVLNEQQRAQLQMTPDTANGAKIMADRQQTGAAASEGTTSDGGAAGEADAQPKPKMNNPNQGFAAMVGPNEPSEKQPANDGFAADSSAAAAAQALASPDGAYSAVISEDRHVVISDKQGILVFTSQPWSVAAEVVLISWSSDNKLTYRITENQVTSTYVIDAVKRSEVKQAR